MPENPDDSMECEECDSQKIITGFQQCLNCYAFVCADCWNDKDDPDFCKSCWEKINAP